MRDIDLSALKALAQNHEGAQGAPAEASAQAVPPRLAQLARARQQIAQTYQAQQAALLRSEDLRGMILRGLAGDMQEDMLLRLALECVGVVVGDDAFTRQALDLLDGRDT